ncbi:RNA polymerase sigma factor, partial [Helicobacter pylori]|uniref:RNA polymerase sigma factor n=1 Tax=Helicobacter pylori TaxID=210 RepID=UPI0029282738
ALYRRHVRPVYWIAYGLLGEGPDSEDVAQDTFLTAWRKLPELTLESDSALPWLATICRFQAANRIRRRARERQHRTDA